MGKLDPFGLARSLEIGRDAEGEGILGFSYLSRASMGTDTSFAYF
jgi:hypothetical protein